MTSSTESPQREAAVFRTIRSWGITRGDRGVIGGVVDGLAQRVGMATVPARIIVVVGAIVLNGLVLLAYGAAWALLPDRRGNIIIQNFGRGVPNVGALIGIGLLGLFGLGGLDNNIPAWIGNQAEWGYNGGWRVVAIIFGLIIPLAVVGGIVWLIVYLVRRSQDPTAGVAAAAPGAPSAAGTAPAAAAAPTTAGASATAGASTTDAPTAPVPPIPPAPPAYAAVPPAPRRPRVPGPGRGFYLMALAWTVLSAAGIAWADREEMLGVHPFVAWFVTFVAGLGVLLILVSLSGRRLGFLGFVGVTLALPTLGLAASANEIRDAYENNSSAITIDFSDEFGPQPAEAPSPVYDPTLDFARDYSEVIINGSCAKEARELWDPATSARLTIDDLTEDRSVDATAEVTYLTIPAGANFVIDGVGDAQATVIWPARELTCDFWGSGGTHLSLTNPDAPTLSVVVKDDEYMNTIVITEEQP